MGRGPGVPGEPDAPTGADDLAEVGVADDTERRGVGEDRRVFGFVTAAAGAAQLAGILLSGYLADRTTVYLLLADAALPARCRRHAPDPATGDLHFELGERGLD